MAPNATTVASSSSSTSHNIMSAANMIKTDFESSHKVLGVLGGAQLGRMMAR